jgi:hypothetical protein
MALTELLLAAVPQL